MEGLLLKRRGEKETKKTKKDRERERDGREKTRERERETRESARNETAAWDDAFPGRVSQISGRRI